MLHEVLPEYTKMQVDLITEKLDIQPNHVFIILKSVICIFLGMNSG